MTDTHRHAPFAQQFEQLVANVARVIQGKEDVIRQAVICLLSGGHLLVEDVPGVGKTTLARALAHSVQLSWGRIQFTPDLLPTDVTGVTIYNQSSATFEFRHGPIFANIVVADEINRASPKTQSALLEVMEEGTVTTDAVVYPVPQPFMVIATQNPIDMEGTYLLPEAQLDRFLMRISVGYPAAEAEAMVLRTQKDAATVDELSPVLALRELDAMIADVKAVQVAPVLERYIVAISQHTRDAPEVRLGVSPRGSLALLKASRTTAAAAGRSFVTPEDVKVMAPSVLSHRIILRPEAELQGHTASEVVVRALQTVPVPRRVDV